MKENPSLPGRLVRVDGTNYHIHGLVHGNPLIRLTPEFKQEVNKSLYGLEVISEDGFSEWINGSRSLNESEHFGYDSLSLSKLFFALRSYLHNRFILRSHKSPLAVKVKEMRSVQELILIREELFRTYPPEPEGMNSLLSTNNNGTIDSLHGKLPNRIKRYLYEAGESIRYAQTEKLQDLHIVVGCSHELPLEYLLLHPEILDQREV
jgi:hypothetical protein